MAVFCRNIGRLVVCVVLPLASATAQINERVSVSWTGAQANGHSDFPALSSDGRYVAFESAATNLVPVDSNGAGLDVFVRDRVAGTTELISVGNAGQQSSGRIPSISADGRYVAFSADSLDVLDTNGVTDVYVRDRLLGTTIWVSQAAITGASSGSLSYDAQTIAFRQLTSPTLLEARRLSGELIDQIAVGVNVWATRVSGDGSTVGFSTQTNQTGQLWTWTLGTSTAVGYSLPHLASILADIDADGDHLVYASPFTPQRNLYVWDTQTSTSTAISVRPNGSLSTGRNEGGSISADGRYVLFNSDDPALVPFDTNGGSDIFVRDLWQRATVRVNFSFAAQQLLTDCYRGVLSSNASKFAFVSLGDQIVQGDTNLRSDVFVSTPCAQHYLDLDGDGFGRPSAPTLVCFPAPIGYSLNALDCNDDDPTVSPGAPELCNGIDDDCDLVVDDGLAVAYFLDGDGDGFGDPNQTLVTCQPQPVGFVTDDTDCDDAVATTYPGAPELCNGVDDDCDEDVDEDWLGSSYCTSSTTSSGCVPVISAVGSPRASEASGFEVQVEQVDGQRIGLFFYGLTPAAQQWAPFNTSVLCVAAPRQRTNTQNSSGTVGVCDGTFVLDVLAWAAAHPNALAVPFQAGTHLHVQAWFRDPPAPGATNLSNAWSVVLCP